MNRFIFIFGLIILVLLTSLSLAGIPKLINYQGMLTDNLGNPLSDTVSITFKIYNDPTVGTKKWEEAQNNVVVTNGLFNVILGSVTPIDTLSFTEQYWLDITVGAEHMPSRLRFTSVAYAYRAQWADTAEYAKAVDLTPLDSRYVNEGQSNSITSGMIQDYTIVRTDVAANFKAPYSDTADYAKAAPGVPGSYAWAFRITDGADTTITTGGAWGIARYGNILYGNADSTHVNLGVACATGTSGQNYKYCTVGGGYKNSASNHNATVGGGHADTASGYAATVGGGTRNTASDQYATVSGGTQNAASQRYATVGGGYNNTASDWYATVGGGVDNAASNNYSTVGGGHSDTASGYEATVGGGNRNVANGGRATIGGGGYNTVSGDYATVGGGKDNTANGDSSTIGGGTCNTASAMHSTIGGGQSNDASYDYATIGGGRLNRAGSYSTVGGGHNNTAGYSSAVGGGLNNLANGYEAAVPGGYADTAAGDCSFAAGQQVRITSVADHTFAFGYNFTTSTPNAVIFYHTGEATRVGINKTNPTYALDLPNNADASGRGRANSWTIYSSIRWKENINPIDHALDKVQALRGVYFNWKESKKQDIGMIAEEVGKIIPEVVTYEENGVDAQALDYARLTAVLVEAIKELKTENEELRKRIVTLEDR